MYLIIKGLEFQRLKKKKKDEKRKEQDQRVNVCLFQGIIFLSKLFLCVLNPYSIHIFNVSFLFKSPIVDYLLPILYKLIVMSQSSFDPHNNISLISKNQKKKNVYSFHMNVNFVFVGSTLLCKGCCIQKSCTIIIS